MRLKSNYAGIDYYTWPRQIYLLRRVIAPITEDYCISNLFLTTSFTDLFKLYICKSAM